MLTHYALSLYEDRAAELRGTAARERLADTARRYRRSTATTHRRGSPRPTAWARLTHWAGWARLAGRRRAAA